MFNNKLTINQFINFYFNFLFMIPIKQILKDFLFIPFYYLSWLSPRDKDTWIFQSWDTNNFIDNAKYFYLYCSKKPVRAILISKNKKVVRTLRAKGFDVRYIWSLNGIKAMLRAKEYIIDNAFIGPGLWMKGSARTIQLWHGVAIKRIGYNLYPRKKARLIEFYKRYLIPWKSYHKKDIFITTCTHNAKMISEGFKTNPKNTLLLGYPRHEALITKKNQKSFFYQKEIDKLDKLKKQGAKLLFYAPSWGHKITDINEILNLKRLIPLLKDNNTYLVTKAHKIGKLSGYISSDHLISLPLNIDTYAVLPKMDLLITDYSSLAQDFLFLDKPILFYPYDIEWYKKNINPFYLDFYKHTPGFIAHSKREFIDKIKEFFKGKDEYEEQRKKDLDFWFKYQDGKSSKRIYNFIKNN